MSRGYHYECAKGCGQFLESHWRYCPMCGQNFGRGGFGTVACSRRRRDGKVKKVLHGSPGGARKETDR